MQFSPAILINDDAVFALANEPMLPDNSVEQDFFNSWWQSVLDLNEDNILSIGVFCICVYVAPRDHEYSRDFGWSSDSPEYYHLWVETKYNKTVSAAAVIAQYRRVL